MNPGDNSGAEFCSDPGTGIQLLWGVLLSSYTSLGECTCLYGTHINPSEAGVDFHPQEEELGTGDSGGSSKECSQARVSSARCVQLTSHSSPSMDPSQRSFSLPSCLLEQMLKKHLGGLDMVGRERKSGLGPGLA